MRRVSEITAEKGPAVARIIAKRSTPILVSPIWPLESLNVRRNGRSIMRQASGCVAIIVIAVVCSQQAIQGWGWRAHVVINQLAVQNLPDDGPVFLKAHAEWIAQTGPLPDTWRDAADPFLKIVEDPNHHWYKEAFAF